MPESSFSLSHFKSVDLSSGSFPLFDPQWDLSFPLFFLFFSLSKKKKHNKRTYRTVSLCHFTLDCTYQLFIYWVLFDVV